MSKAQVSVDITLLFTALVIIAVYSFATFFFISTTDNARIGMAREEWRNEALFLANYLISSPNCMGYSRNTIFYDNSTGTGVLVTSKTGVPYSIDVNKLNMDRLRNCARFNTPEYNILFEVRVFDETHIFDLGSNIDKNVYFNPTTYEQVVIPIKLIYDNHISYGRVELGFSVNMEYFKTRVA